MKAVAFCQGSLNKPTSLDMWLANLACIRSIDFESKAVGGIHTVSQ